MKPQTGTDTPAVRVKTVAPVSSGYFGYYPGAVAVVTSAHAERVNVMSAGWHTALSETPPLYGVAVAPERHSHDLIRDSGLFAVNFLPFEHAPAIAGAGLLSGADLDKFARLQLGWQPGEFTGLPVLDAAYITYECRVTDSVRTGDHTFFVGEVLGLTYLPEAFQDRQQDSRAVPSVAYYGRSTYEELGSGRRQFLPPQLYRGTPEDPA